LHLHELVGDHAELLVLRMMQNQMGFAGQGMYNIDPNMNMQMMFNPQGSGNDPQNQQFGMIPNQFMQMQNLMMGI
jgi:hypothetical protein